MDTNLTDDCLRHVFKHLPLYYRLRDENVCKKWMRIMPYVDIHALKLDDLPWNMKYINELTFTLNNVTHTQRVLSVRRFTRALECLLCRIGYNLHSLTLTHQHIRTAVTEDIANMIAIYCPNLKRLCVQGCIVYIQALSELAKLTNLHHLNFEGCTWLDQNTNQPPTMSIEEQTELLTSVVKSNKYLSMISLGPGGVIPRLSSTAITHVHINNNTTMDNQHLAEICRSCPNIRDLSVANCIRLTQFAPVAMLHNLHSFMAHCTNINTSDLSLIASACAQLEVLRIDTCRNITSYSCLRQLTRLRALWVGPTDKFGDIELARVAKHGLLESALFSSCRISDEGLRYLASHCRRLHEISACNLPITDEGVKCLLADCPKLRLLNIQGTNITNACLSHVGQLATVLKQLYIQDCPQIDEWGFTALMYARRTAYDEAGKNGEAAPCNLMIMAGGHSGQPIPHGILEHLRSVGVHVEVQLPLLALGFMPN